MEVSIVRDTIRDPYCININHASGAHIPTSPCASQKLRDAILEVRSPTALTLKYVKRRHNRRPPQYLDNHHTTPQGRIKFSGVNSLPLKVEIDEVQYPPHISHSSGTHPLTYLIYRRPGRLQGHSDHLPVIRSLHLHMFRRSSGGEEVGYRIL